MLAGLTELDIGVKRSRYGRYDAIDKQLVDDNVEIAMSNCKLLTKLALYCDGDASNLTPFLRIEYPSLRDFSIQMGSDDDASHDLLFSFFQKHPLIKSLNYMCPDNTCVHNGILELKHLEELCIRPMLFKESDTECYTLDIIPRLSKFPNLRHLHMYGELDELPPFKHPTKQLTSLTISLKSVINYRSSEDKVFHFVDNLNKIKNLPNPIKFELDHEGETEIILSNLIDVVQDCDKLQKLIVPGFKQRTGTNVQRFRSHFDTSVDHGQIHKKFAVACQMEGITYDKRDGNDGGDTTYGGNSKSQYCKDNSKIFGLIFNLKAHWNMLKSVLLSRIFFTNFLHLNSIQFIVNKD